MTRVYFQRPEVVVTDRLFVRRTENQRTENQRTFAVAELRNSGTARRAEARSAGYHVAVAGGALAVIALGALTGERLATTTGWIGAAAGVVIVLGWSGLSLRARRRIWELRATYRGAEVLLYRSPDDVVFHQVARALRRAIEDARPRPARTGPEDTGDGDDGDGT
jgi:hypothetical protein